MLSKSNRCCETAYECACEKICPYQTISSHPHFEIVPEENHKKAIAASSALTCHSNLLKAIGALRYLLAV
jgi:hypothetical protein